MFKRSVILFFFLICTTWCTATDLIYNSRTATALNKVSFFSDSTFTAHTNIAFNEGMLFEVIGESYNEHEDDSQNQKFKWFNIRTMDGKEGWLYGDGIAVVLRDDLVEEHLRKFHKREVNFNNGFENAVIWLASIEGRDNMHESDFMNPLYNEYYIVITNQRNQSVHINYAGSSAMGRNELSEFQLQDITGDQIPELILMQSTFPISSDQEERQLEIYSMQAGTLTKVFNERMTLNYDQDIPSPALFKHVEVENKMIRVEYIDYAVAKRYTLGKPIDAKGDNYERYLEYVTYTYLWDQRRKMYQPIYEETRTAPFAKAKKQDVYIKDAPNEKGNSVMQLSPNDELEVIKHYENYSLSNGKKIVETYLLVRNPLGRIGYVKADNLTFVKSAHASTLNSYYQSPPLSKSNWKTTQSFIKLPKHNPPAMSQR